MKRSTATIGRFAPAVLALAASIAAGCSGSPGTPSGPQVNSPGGPNPPPVTLVNAGANVRIANWSIAKPQSRLRAQYLSSRTQSVVVALASVDGGAPSGVNATTINTYPTAPNCKLAGGTLSCSGTVSAVPGRDVFNVTSFAGPDGNGALLAAGTVTAQIGSSGGNVQINTDQLAVRGIISSMTMSLSPAAVVRGKGSTVRVALDAFDASGGKIAGNSPYASPITLSIEGDSSNSFTLGAAGSSTTSIAVTKPSQHLAVLYNGSQQANSITLQASVTSPNSASATATIAVNGTPPPPPPGRLYVLNAGANDGLDATVTEYGGTATGNVAPTTTLQLNPKLYARSIAVDAGGNLYVGYLDSVTGFEPSNGSPDTGNLIEEFAPGASGAATPKATIAADPATNSLLFPIAMAIDKAGDVVTYGATSVDGNSGDAVVIYAPGSNGAVAPAHAWNFVTPQIRYAGPTGLALDSTGNFYVNGILHTSLGPSYGVFANLAQNESNPAAPVSRTIPWDATTQLTPGFVSDVTIDSSGAVDVGNFALTGTTTLSCQGEANIFSGGATGGTTDNPPLRVVTFAGVTTTNPLCYKPNNPLAGYFPYVTAYATTLFVADEFNDTVGAYASGSSGSVSPTTLLAGSSTGLASPIGVAVSSVSAREASRRDKPRRSVLVH